MKEENFVLSIAIDKYSDSMFQDLDNAVSDSLRFQNVLLRNYNYKTIQDPIFNENATRRRIIDVLNNLSTSITANDNLIIYYAGHGLLHPKTSKGFWIPFDGEKQSISNYISNSDIIDSINAIEAKHILLISDSCFAGSLLTKTRNISENNSYLKLGQKKSRYLFTSGRIEVVSDGKPGKGSPFANALIKFFEENKKKYFSFTEMASYVKRVTGNAATQQPVYGSIGEYNGGEMIFEFSEFDNEKNKAIQENQSNWEKNFNLFCEAKETRKEWPFISKENPETKSLGIWCSEQRSYKRKGKLNPDREQRLLVSGFVFDPQLERFFNGLRKFLIFMEKEKGYNYVPNHLLKKYKEEESWLRVQQKWYRKVPCDPTNSKSYPLYRYEILKRNDIILVPESNSERWEALKKDIAKFYETHEKYVSLPSQNDKDSKIASLGNKVNDHMVMWKRNELSLEKVKFLEQYIDINYGKNKLLRNFERQVQEYISFKNKHPNSEPKQGGKYKIIAGRIAQWKSKKRNGKLPLWQEQILKAKKVPFE